METENGFVIFFHGCYYFLWNLSETPLNDSEPKVKLSTVAGIQKTFQNYFSLTKPRIIVLLSLTGIVGYLLPKPELEFYKVLTFFIIGNYSLSLYIIGFVIFSLSIYDLLGIKSYKKCIFIPFSAMGNS